MGMEAEVEAEVEAGKEPDEERMVEPNESLEWCSGRVDDLQFSCCKSSTLLDQQHARKE